MKRYKLTQNFGPFNGYLIYEDGVYMADGPENLGGLTDRSREINTIYVVEDKEFAETILSALNFYESERN